MFHLDVPKTRQYDTGKVEVIARNSVGESIASTELNVVARSDDYRNVLKNSPRRKFYFQHKPENLGRITYITAIRTLTIFKMQ